MEARRAMRLAPGGSRYLLSQPQARLPARRRLATSFRHRQRATTPQHPAVRPDRYSLADRQHTEQAARGAIKVCQAVLPQLTGQSLQCLGGTLPGRSGSRAGFYEVRAASSKLRRGTLAFRPGGGTAAPLSSFSLHSGAVACEGWHGEGGEAVVQVPLLPNLGTGQGTDADVRVRPQGVEPGARCAHLGVVSAGRNESATCRDRPRCSRGGSARTSRSSVRCPRCRCSRR